MSTSDPFVDYYAEESLKPSTLQRFQGTKDAVIRTANHLGLSAPPWKVADIGCGAGTQCEMWARDGHRVFGLDINPALIELARNRMAKKGVDVDLRVGSGASLPWASESMDVVLCPELLEPVQVRSCWSACRIGVAASTRLAAS